MENQEVRKPNRTRIYVYSALALPFVAFGVYAATRSPLERSSFLAEFKHKAVAMFSGESDAPPQGLEAVPAAEAVPQGSDAEPGGGPGDEGAAGERGRRGRGGGGFDPEAIFQRRDTDGDGKLSGDEIQGPMRENLDQIDTDQDGSVTLEEFRDGVQRLFANRGGGGGPGAGRPGRDGQSGGGRGRGAGGPGGDPREGKPDRPQRPESE